MNLIRSVLILISLMITSASFSTEKTYTKRRKLNENVPSELMINMQNWILFRKPGDVQDFAGGKLYRIDEGARFVDAMGITVVIPKDRPDYNYIANKSPVLAKFWLEKYGFKPNPPDYEYETRTQVDDHLSFFDSLVRALKILRDKEAELRKKISSHPGVRKDFSCTNIGVEVDDSALADIKSLCQDLNKSGIDHQQLFLKLKKIKSEMDARGPNDLSLPSEDLKFEKDFSPFIFIKK